MRRKFKVRSGLAVAHQRSRETCTITLRVMRIVRAAVIAIMAAMAAAGCGSVAGLFQQYEYEEEVYLSLDGTATVYVNASIPALNALRGATFNPNPQAPVDREAVR